MPHSANTKPERGLFCRNDLGGGGGVEVGEDAESVTKDVTVCTWPFLVVSNTDSEVDVGVVDEEEGREEEELELELEILPEVEEVAEVEVVVKTVLENVRRFVKDYEEEDYKDIRSRRGSPCRDWSMEEIKLIKCLHRSPTGG